ncbi:YfiR family protein [Segetibacter sp. 3557_3]|uniref:YfiR family protein n=1 Tax=Segetibacter sp. 3557_3 TaxID=2547429 RepID=UPI001058C1D8|nr:YfiR family protein [Segetibacter sp. 3557_3]TDH21670.1 YfiR family protein [Segetibacter sp. 3557_3]
MRKYLKQISPGIRVGRTAMALFMTCSLLSAYTQSSSREYNIKAAFLFNFSQFVVWPEHAFGAPGSPFVIGILGDDPFKTVIDQTVAGEKVKDHPIVVQRYATIKEVLPCHILYVPEKTEGNIPALIAALPARYTLTVGEQYAFARLGGIVRFQTLNNKIRLQINLAAAKAAELNISSKMLRLADIVAPVREQQ